MVTGISGLQGTVRHSNTSRQCLKVHANVLEKTNVTMWAKKCSSLMFNNKLLQASPCKQERILLRPTKKNFQSLQHREKK